MVKLTILMLMTALQSLLGEKILYVEREQYRPDHHNTATMFMRGEVNEGSFNPGAALCIHDMATGSRTVLLETSEGVIRDPELSYDATRIVFSMRPEFDDGYHIYEIGVDGKGLRQLTEGRDVADIDPVYLPDGKIAFSSTRQQKYCMCNQHIMYNLYTMNPDGSGVNQIGVSTLAEGHASVLSDGRLIYDRWEYVDRNFADAQGLWTVNPDGTKHSVFYGNNTNAPGGARADAETAVKAGFVHIQMYNPSEEVLGCVNAYLEGLEALPSPYLVKGKLSKKARAGRKVFVEYVNSL